MPINTLATARRREARVLAVLAGLVTELGAAEPDPEHTHRMRVAIKKLRGWIRLLRFAESRQTGVRVDRALRALAHSLATERDWHVIAQTLRRLREETRSVRDRARLTDLRRRLQSPAATATPPKFPTELLPALRRLCMRQPDSALLLHGFERSYHRARKSGARATRPGSAPALRHAWRRRVKYLYYQSRFISEGGKTAWQRALDELGAVLGELQDFQLLKARLSALPADAATAAAARQLAHAAQRRLARVKRLYRRCFGKKALRLRA
jgi:CHAD domain-containing protein